MINLRRYHVRPYLPGPLEPLVALAKNLHWTWNREAREVFVQIDRALFERVSENPLALLARAPRVRLDELARDAGYLASIDRATRALADYLARETWFQRTFAAGEPITSSRIAYFSMEFGVHECLPVYSGGLGVLAGDHLKSASDLGLPLIGVGVAFSQGYFRQSLDDEGWQHERYPPNDWHDLPVSPVSDGAGNRVVVSVPIAQEGEGGASREVRLEAWRVDVGRVPLILLDANLPGNAPEDRLLTNTLYGGDRAHRIRQEILLGVGGVRMLAAIGVHPTVCHMNEGHSAFLAIERVRQLMVEHGAPFDVARTAAAAGNVFTTHTPVPAGNDAFPHAMIAPYLQVLGAGLSKTGDELMRLGSAEPDAKDGHFSMPVLAIRMADRYNGVSVLHGREARVMWTRLWPTIASHDVPIGAITNGVHVGTWVTPEMADLYDRALGPGWRGDVADAATWARIADVPDEDLWHVHEQRRARLVREIRERMSAFAERRGLPKLLDPRALTIGFARRFATYKRATLLLRDPARLERILAGAGRPVQLVFSGKAHPQDIGGKELIREIVRASMHGPFKGRILFLEDYDMGVARSLVAGVDVWLNTPRRPLEASGTSGMKACLNGVLHASVLDGWWPEAYLGDNGYAVGRGEEYSDAERGDRIEAEALYELLEHKIVPLFYDRDGSDVPRGWVARMKRSIATIGPVFTSTRMVREYAEGLYAPAARRFRQLTGEGMAGARAFDDWRARVTAAWPHVRIEAVDEQASSVAVGEAVDITADVSLGGLHPGDVAVELYYGPLQGGHALRWGKSAPMTLERDLGAHRYRFHGTIPATESGEHAFAVRVLPSHEGLPNRFAIRLVAWS